MTQDGAVPRRSGQTIATIAAKLVKLPFRERVREAQAAFGKSFYASVEPPVGRHITLRFHHDGARKQLLNFRTCNYLGLSDDPRLAEAAVAAVKKYGLGASSSPIGTGRTTLHAEVEERLAAFYQRESAMLMSSGFLMNFGIVTGLPTASDLVFLDRYIHTSFVDGMRASAAKAVWFKHNDVADLDDALRERRAQATDAFVVVEGVYSMEADMPDLRRTCEVAQAHRALVVLDDCHGLGTTGATGRGTEEHCGGPLRADVLCGTLSKAVPVTGGYVTGERDVIDYLRLRANGYGFSASTATPADVAAVLASLDILEREPARVTRLQALVARLVSRLGDYHAQSAGGIVNVSVPTAALDHVESALFEAGFGISLATYPAVPVGRERLRILVSAAHEESDVDALADAVRAVFAAHA